MYGATMKFIEMSCNTFHRNGFRLSQRRRHFYGLV